eukprot:scaffold63263_cov21-Tisochrysis_lutea.AAC.1
MVHRLAARFVDTQFTYKLVCSSAGHSLQAIACACMCLQASETDARTCMSSHHHLVAPTCCFISQANLAWWLGLRTCRITLTCNTTSPLHDTGQPDKAAASLKPLMDTAMKTVPKELQVGLAGPSVMDLAEEASCQAS